MAFRSRRTCPGLESVAASRCSATPLQARSLREAAFGIRSKVPAPTNPADAARPTCANARAALCSRRGCWELGAKPTRESRPRPAGWGTRRARPGTAQAQARFRWPPLEAPGRARARGGLLRLGGGPSAYERTGRDVRRATPDVTGPCVVAAGLPQRLCLARVVWSLGAAFGGRAARAAATRTTTRRPGIPSRRIATPTSSPASGGAWPAASYFPAQLSAGLGAAAERSTDGRRAAPAFRDGPRAHHPARAPCEGGTGLASRPVPNCAPLWPPGALGLPRLGGAATG